jgi:long-chain acyl-CoA synthetase
MVASAIGRLLVVGGMSVSERKPGEAKQRDRVPLGRAAARLAKHVEKALSQRDLSLPQYRVLIMLGDGSAVASALASKLSVSPPSVTAIVDGLVARGLVSRQSDGGDRRRVTHALTDKGRRVLAEADAETNARLEAIGAHLAPRDRERALEGLRLWREAMDAYLSASFTS